VKPQKRGRKLKLKEIDNAETGIELSVTELLGLIIYKETKYGWFI
jgi:hypothetical protein